MLGIVAAGTKIGGKTKVTIREKRLWCEMWTFFHKRKSYVHFEIGRYTYITLLICMLGPTYSR